MSNQGQINLDNQLKEMGLSSEQLNGMIEMVNKDVMCDATCQREKKLEDLYNKMLKAEKNLEDAPNNLANARRSYYIFKDGENNYNNTQQSKLRSDAILDLKKVKEEFDKRVDRTQTMVDEYEAMLVYTENMDELLNTQITKNQRLSKDIDNIKTKIFTNDRRYHYFDESVEWQTYLNNIISFTFWVLIVYYIAYFLLYKGNYTDKRKVLYGLFILLVPFVLTFFITFKLFGVSIKLILDRIISLFTGNQFPTD